MLILVNTIGEYVNQQNIRVYLIPECSTKFDLYIVGPLTAKISHRSCKNPTHHKSLDRPQKICKKIYKKISYTPLRIKLILQAILIGLHVRMHYGIANIKTFKNSITNLYKDELASVFDPDKPCSWGLARSCGCHWQQQLYKYFLRFFLIQLGGALHGTPGPLCTLPLGEKKKKKTLLGSPRWSTQHGDKK